MNGDDHPTLPPVRLLPEAELARAALGAPLVVRAVSLVRWAGEGIRVGAGGELLGEQLRLAAEHLELEQEDATSLAAEAWDAAVDVGLIEIAEDEPGDEEAPAMPDADEDVALATPGPELEAFTRGSPEDVLAIWEGLFAVLVTDAAMPSFEDLLGDLPGMGGDFDPDSLDLGELNWDPEAEADFLDHALANLYVLTIAEAAAGQEANPFIPLPVLAASLSVPEDAGEPTEEMLAEVSTVMMRLDEQFRILEPTGAVEFRPVDEELIAEVEGEAVADFAEEEEDITRYGMVRLTPLGQYGIRRLMQDEGVHAPAVGDLADRDADALFVELARYYPEDSALEELALWIEAREALPAVRELLVASRGEDSEAPRRRLLCQQSLSHVGREAEPALREVLDDQELGGLARVWLTEQGVADVPPPSEEMIFWLTVDTFAAQLAGEPGGEESEELKELMLGLVDQHSGFFDKVWRVPHPATADVLDAMGRLHPDRGVAKEARKAAHRARSHH